MRRLSEVNFLVDRHAQPGRIYARRTRSFSTCMGGTATPTSSRAKSTCSRRSTPSRRSIPIDENRIVVRGFSMGGAAAWQFAAHFAGKWAAAAPGAGFSESADFLKVYQNEAVKPTWWEEKLYHMYDATDYAANLYNCPTVAYSGEIDRQIQAARMMEKALAAGGHDAEARHRTGYPAPVSSRLQDRDQPDPRRAREKGRDPYPRKLRFTTFTLAYNEMKWVTIDAHG